MTEEKIINRIRKMLALASDAAATEGERDNALRMAYSTMAKYNIDQAQVEAAGKKGEERLNFTVEGWSMLWSVHIHNAIAKLFFCKYLRGGKINGTKLNHKFIGKESNVLTASYLATFVVTSILKEGRAKGWHNLSSEMRSFGLGAVDKLYARVKEIQGNAQQEQASQPGTALVLASVYRTEEAANLAFLESEGMRIKQAKATGRAASNRDAYAAGKEFGGKINLSVQVGGNQAERLG